MPVGRFFNNSSNYKVIQIPWGIRAKGQNPKPSGNPKFDFVKWQVGRIEGCWRSNLEAEGKRSGFLLVDAAVGLTSVLASPPSASLTLYD